METLFEIYKGLNGEDMELVKRCNNMEELKQINKENYRYSYIMIDINRPLYNI